MVLEALALISRSRKADANEDAQETLFLKICSYRCGTLDEQRIRAKNLLTCPAVTDFWDLSATPSVDCRMTAQAFSL